MIKASPRDITRGNPCARKDKSDRPCTALVPSGLSGISLSFIASQHSYACKRERERKASLIWHTPDTCTCCLCVCVWVCPECISYVATYHRKLGRIGKDSASARGWWAPARRAPAATRISPARTTETQEIIRSRRSRMACGSSVMSPACPRTFKGAVLSDAPGHGSACHEMSGGHDVRPMHVIRGCVRA